MLEPPTARPITPKATPTTQPARPDHAPCRANVALTMRGSAPFDESWPMVTNCRRALLANAAAMMMPSTVNISTPTTQPQASVVPNWSRRCGGGPSAPSAKVEPSEFDETR